ncbi:MAG: hypothetical protein U1E36_04970 [Rickettsiales bacterium]
MSDTAKGIPTATVYSADESAKIQAIRLAANTEGPFSTIVVTSDKDTAEAVKAKLGLPADISEITEACDTKYAITYTGKALDISPPEIASVTPDGILQRLAKAGFISDKAVKQIMEDGELLNAMSYLSQHMQNTDPTSNITPMIIRGKPSAGICA